MELASIFCPTEQTFSSAGYNGSQFLSDVEGLALLLKTIHGKRLLTDAIEVSRIDALSTPLNILAVLRLLCMRAATMPNGTLCRIKDFRVNPKRNSWPRESWKGKKNVNSA